MSNSFGENFMKRCSFVKITLKKSILFTILMLLFASPLFAAPQPDQLKIKSYKDFDGAIYFRTEGIWKERELVFVKYIDKSDQEYFWVASPGNNLSQYAVITIGDGKFVVEQKSEWPQEWRRIHGYISLGVASFDGYSTPTHLIKNAIYEIPAELAEKIIQSSDSEDIIGNFAIGDDYEKFRIDFKKKKASLVKMFTLTRQDYDTYRVPPKKDYTDEKSIPFYK